MAADTYEVTKDKFPTSITAQGALRRAYLVAPSDTQDLTNPANAAASVFPLYPRRLYFTKALTACKVTMAGEGGEGKELNIGPIPAGTQMDITVRRVWATGTDATPGIIGFCD